MTKTVNGFTIVELLIVIVVIAILAAISVVAYTSLQDRARLSAAKSDFAGIKKSLLMYKTLNSTYPGSQNALIDANLKLTKSAYAPIAGFDNVIYCLNTNTDRFAFVAELAGNAGSVSITSESEVQDYGMTTQTVDVCSLVGATASV